MNEVGGGGEVFAGSYKMYVTDAIFYLFSKYPFSRNVKTL
jgi:hypothetical protein